MEEVLQKNKSEIPKTISEEESREIINKLEEKKLAVLAVDNNKRAFIKEMVFKHGPLWWENIVKDMTRDENNIPVDKELYRVAITEFNKLQARVLPTEITGGDGEQLVMNIVQWTKPETIVDQEDEDDIKK